MKELIFQFHELMKSSVLKCTSDCLAISGGLDSSIVAYHLKDKNIHGFSVISRDFLASDLTYCQIISKTFDFPLKIISATTEMLLDSLEKTIKILKIFNDIEVRNSCVIFLLLSEMKKLGYKKIITGDGADELFAGYYFLQNKSKDEIKKEQERIWEIMHFSSIDIGKYLGVSVETPFLDPKIIDFAKSCSPNLKIHEENNKRFGKWILRKVYEGKIPSSIVWRNKVPMQDGAGTSGLTNLFDILISDDQFESQKKSIQENDGVILRTKESLHYYRIYRKYYEIPSNVKKSETNCPFCNFGVKKDTKFCRMCGSFPI